MDVVEEDVETVVELLLLMLDSWKGRARADPARAAVNRAKEICMLNDGMQIKTSKRLKI